jgi:hypothetical protein
VEAGIRLAADEHQEGGGAAHRVRVLFIGHSPPDTLPDAVACAAALATWRSLDHDADLARIEYHDGWRVSFPPR